MGGKPGSGEAGGTDGDWRRERGSAYSATPGPGPAAGSGDAHDGDGFRLSYDVYKSGFRALSLNFDVALDGGRYRTDARLESAGIIGWLFEWRLEGRRCAIELACRRGQSSSRPRD